MTQDGEPQVKRVKASGDNEEQKPQKEEKNYDKELLEAAKVLFWPYLSAFSGYFDQNFGIFCTFSFFLSLSLYFL